MRWFKQPPSIGRLLVCSLIALSAADSVHAKGGKPLDLEKLTAPEARALMESGQLTSVELTKAYIKRIEALNKRGPGLNAVSQLNAKALEEARILDLERKRGIVRSPAHGMPVLLKDLIDVKGMYTSNGNYSLRNSFPQSDSGVAEKLRERGVVILGKLGLSEYANFFGNQPSGFSNLTGQVLHGLDADQNPSGSSSGSGTAGAAALSLLTIGTETSGSIISPARAQGLVGLRPTVGLVPGVGIGPISASQDTAGPMDRTVTNAAYTLTAIAGQDPESSYDGLWGLTPEQDDIVIPPAPDTVPDYLSALDLGFVAGKRIGYNGDLVNATTGEKTPLGEAYDALVAAGAILVLRPVLSPALVLPTGSILNWEARRDINRYYANLGPDAPIKSLDEELAKNAEESAQALKFGNATHTNVNTFIITDFVGGPTTTDPSNTVANDYKNALLQGKIIAHASIDRLLQNDTPDDPSDDFIAILGTAPNGPRAGYPQITLPMGYNATQRRTVDVNLYGTAYSERDLLGVAYVIEQATLKRQTASAVNPSLYRCAKTEPRPPFASRGDCNPDYDYAMYQAGGQPPELPFALELESVAGLQAKLTAGTLTSEALTKAYLARIALTNAEGPAVQAVRSLNQDAVKEAKALDKERAKKGPRGPLHGIPVLVDDSIDVRKLPTTAGSIALQDSYPRTDSTVVAKLKLAGAIILGKTNVTELNSVFDANMPEGYSSLGGQVLLPSDTDKTPAGSSAGSAAATASGLAAMTIGLETAPEGAQLIGPASVAGVVGLKPTVGRVSRKGILPVAKSQDSPGPIARTVYDAALQLQAIAGSDPGDPATVGAPPVPDYLAGLSTSALVGKKVAIVASTVVPYQTAVSTLTLLGAIPVEITLGTPSPNPPSIVLRELQRDLDAYLAGTGGAGPKTLSGIVDYNTDNPVEGLKYQQGQLLEALVADLSAYESDKVAGQTATRALIDGILSNGTADPSDDFDVVMVPAGNALIGHADRAGYPLLTVPAGEGTGNAGRNPIGVTFVGGAFSEAKLLAAGYALEQGGTYQRRAPSVTNPSMYRCVPGSAFFSGELCHPGDRLLVKGAGAYKLED
jgi:Asp-tRNA(Asn)/Glu-tRNA(Gln) amidotransferase A subunit family amidase